jgi:copper chaperone CopZ
VPTKVRVEQVQIVAEDMCCKGCVRKVSSHLYAARGVREVSVDMKSHTVTVALPQPNSAMLGLLWHAVERGEGGPTKLVSAEATYTLIRPKVEATEAQQKQQLNAPLSIVIDNLHCKGCAKKIAAQLYAVKGITKVSVDMQHETLFVKAQAGTPLSPWNLIHAVTQAKERPLAVNGPYGTLAIEWSTERAPKNHPQTQQTTIGGLQR